MKFDNQDAFKLTMAFMDRKENISSASGYFKTFVETYQKFDRWLSSPDPVKTLNDERSAAKTDENTLF
ncbi:MAG: hypothetical protein QRY16_12240 [Enterobacterales bacterium endosymbiont of Blomia tropicalis]|uniref:hypothetical protein n=1 Tax=Mixta mediterraneensis TaxID=2758443 RepID=UPI0025A89257|nr:hypothetical protein [Mixta mediterraneensis]MDL4914526.1 hypothetical protein [Mixta mediterraneensis]